jgi:hypothetical protein
MVLRETSKSTYREHQIPNPSFHILSVYNLLFFDNDIGIMAPIWVGLVGLTAEDGRMPGKGAHLPTHLKSPNFEIVALCKCLAALKESLLDLMMG